jgi:shikimate dehydrogenase
VENLRQTLPKRNFFSQPATILGAGGSARALVDELLRQGVERINVWNRTASRGEEIAHHFGSAVHSISSYELPSRLQDTGLLINTTSAGMNGTLALDLPWTTLQPQAIVADIVYTPLVTEFLQRAHSHGHDIVPGLGMLLHQAVVGFEKWFDVKPVVTPELYTMVAKDIDPDYVP